MDALNLLQVVWFILWGVLWSVYFMLDGFVLGTGMLHPFLAKSENEKRAMVATVGPVWNGNEVWLITAGGATFAAFPTTYALMFSYLYMPLLLLLFALIIRGVSMEFRHKDEGAGWKRAWDVGIFLGSFLPALLFGVAFGNIFKGLPMDASGYHGSLLTLLNPYGILTGLLFVSLFAVHGALYTSIRTLTPLSDRAKTFAEKAWPVLLIIAGAFLVYTASATMLYQNYLSMPVLLIVPVIAVVSLLLVRVLSGKGVVPAAFAASCAVILTVCATGIIGLFPNLIPSSLDAAYSLTIGNSSSSLLTLSIMTAIALVFVPIVIVYKIWVYRIFSNRISPEEAGAEKAY
ncbi:MAG TPA: cytochrome d ubiquinol oxidase subunit II [Deltaproteobacteria bacterium]|jgi:cytochrome d ubiquinol oxidase subunit II|nr:cytochrome d ubiquinol oxidase subunit II [Deltaproteobacteria bacterium]